MLTDAQIARNRESLVAAMHFAGANMVGGMVVYSSVPICVFFGQEKRIDKKVFHVRFIHDKNWPKIAIDDLARHNFHTEFSTAWQYIRFQPRYKLLIITGVSGKFPNGYKVHIHLFGIKVSRIP